MREDWWLIAPCVILAFIEVRYIWGNLPEVVEKDTEISGGYSKKDEFVHFYLMYAAETIFVVQWACNILPMASGAVQTYLRLIGYGLVVLGFVVAIVSLKKLGSNWTGMANFRIKKGQFLVKDGIYGLVRNPLYLAVLLEILGYELVVNSWLMIPIVAAGSWFYLEHMKKEDALLEKKYGSEFREYRSKVAKILPGIY